MSDTTIRETLRLDVRRSSAPQIIQTVVALLDRQQRGWRVVEIEVTIERHVEVGRGAARPRLTESRHARGST